MSYAKNVPISFDELHDKTVTSQETRFTVRKRGLPKTDPDEAIQRNERRKAFGGQLRGLREKQGLTLAQASDAAGISSARKVSQYETTCYPPGWIVSALAPVYKVDEKYLASLVLAHSDPELFEAIADGMSVDEFAETEN
jgi:hypothetical protein